jgi:hypothetical protein
MQDKPAPDPAAVWASAAPKPVNPQSPAAYEPFAHTAAELRQTEWRWGWSAWIGIHYGPIPVGIIVGIPLLIWLWI